MPSALITGANRGLGFEFAHSIWLMDGRSLQLVVVQHLLSKLRRLAKDSDDKLRMLAMDVTDSASVHAAATELDGQAIDLLLNNAGVIGPRGQTIGNIDYGASAEVLAVNTMGPMRVSEAFVEHVARSGGKLIVTLASGMGSIADNTYWGLGRLMPTGMGSEHGGGKSGDRSRFRAASLASSSIPARCGRTWAGANATLEPSESISRAEASHRDPWARAVRQVLQSHWSRISLVACLQTHAEPLSGRSALKLATKKRHIRSALTPFDL